MLNYQRIWGQKLDIECKKKRMFDGIWFMMGGIDLYLWSWNEEVLCRVTIKIQYVVHPMACSVPGTLLPGWDRPTIDMFYRYVGTTRLGHVLAPHDGWVHNQRGWSWNMMIQTMRVCGMWNTNQWTLGPCGHVEAKTYRISSQGRFMQPFIYGNHKRPFTIVSYDWMSCKICIFYHLVAIQRLKIEPDFFPLRSLLRSFLRLESSTFASDFSQLATWHRCGAGVINH